MTGTRNLRPTRRWVFLLLLGVLLAAGCSTGNSNSGANLVDAQGNHPAGFLSTHPGFAVSDITQCTPCHGSDLTGGIAKTSCFTSACHHGTIPTWAQAAVHGASAKRAPGASGFASCRICHGNGFSGGGSGVSCFITCHRVNAPHPPAPWRTAGGTNHDNTNTANAPVCATCHFPGSQNNPPGHPDPATPAPAGTPPGCFNNTLCHGAATTPHILGATWTEPTSTAFHGLEAKRDLGFCQSCHGTPGTILFDGGVASTKCSVCHTAAKAHPTTWYQAPVVTFPGYVASHRNSLNQSTTCSICHDYTQGRLAPNPVAPSCFSASFPNADGITASCHPGGPGSANHLVPFLDPVHLGVDTAGFNSDCSNCHAVSGASPVAAAPACQVCHTAGSPLSPTGSFGNCSSCHGSPPPPLINAQPNGTTYPNIAGAHFKHLALDNLTLTGGSNVVDCDTCHDGLGFVTQEHYDRANARPGLNAQRVPPGDLAFPPSFPYTAQSGTLGFDNTLAALSCSAIKCHGGATPTPNWQTGAIATGFDAGCRTCHKAANTGSPQYNDVTNNVHPTHITHAFGRNIDCTICHDPAQLTPLRHFGNLVDNVIAAGEARATIQASLGYDPTGSVTINSCSTGCH